MFTTRTKRVRSSTSERHDPRPIGVFDSGVGGLTVLRAMRRRFPRERLIYLGDTARVPYGNKSRDTIIRYALETTIFLTSKNIKVLVIACNTSSAYSLERLRATFSVPVVGVIEPGVREALSATRKGRVGVIGTAGTINSGAYQNLLTRARRGLKVAARACPLFVSLAEEGWTRGAVAYAVARTYLAPIRSQGIDTLILGCTHYPLLKGPIGRAMGRGVTLIDSAEAVARSVEDLLLKHGLTAAPASRGGMEILSTDIGGSFGAVARRFLGSPLPPVRRVLL
ncbi:MAG: glutamate racemase [Nitrospirae bacterium]|nr:glutamate racemase [Nitrospirota bacterium]